MEKDLAPAGSTEQSFLQKAPERSETPGHNLLPCPHHGEVFLIFGVLYTSSLTLLVTPAVHREKWVPLGLTHLKHIKKTTFYLFSAQIKGRGLASLKQLSQKLWV